MMKYSIGDKVIDSTSKRQGKIVDIVEEKDNDGNVSYAAAKIKFESGESDWVNNDKIVFLLVEDDIHNVHELL